MVRDDKRGFIKAHTPGILQKLELDESTWMETLHGYSNGFYSFVGPEAQLKTLCQNQKNIGFEALMRVEGCLKALTLSPLPLKSLFYLFNWSGNTFGFLLPDIFRFILTDTLYCSIFPKSPLFISDPILFFSQY